MTWIIPHLIRVDPVQVIQEPSHARVVRKHDLHEQVTLVRINAGLIPGRGEYSWQRRDSGKIWFLLFPGWIHHEYCCNKRQPGRYRHAHA